MVMGPTMRSVSKRLLPSLRRPGEPTSQRDPTHRPAERRNGGGRASGLTQAELHSSTSLVTTFIVCHSISLVRHGSPLDERLPNIGAVLDALRDLRTGNTVLDPSTVDYLIRRGDTLGMEDLTPREIDVLEQLAHGLSNKAIADQLHISVKSIEKGITAIFLKLGPFDQGSSDRRVSAALVFLRTQTDPFGPMGDSESPTTPIVVLKKVDELLDTSKTPN